jgi:glycosyltransferase involved in cell wall biosynthesis
MTEVVNPGAGDASLPRITLAIFFFNQARFVEETVRSAFAQSYGNTEILFSDDGSWDGTGDLLLRLARDYSGPHRIIVNVNEKNKGFGKHFASAITLCTGEWIATQGGDDIAAPERLEILSDYVAKYPDAMAIGCAGSRIDGSGNVLGMTHFVPSLYRYEKYSGGIFRVSNLPEPPGKVELTPVLGATAAYRRSVVMEPTFPDDLADEDLFLSLRAISRGEVLMIPECLVRRRVDPNSLSFYRKTNMTRGERRLRRLKISRMRYLAYKAACRELVVEKGKFDGFERHLAESRARALLQCFEDPVCVDSAGLYGRAFKDALKSIGWFRLAEDALGRGRLLLFLYSYVLSLIIRRED